MSTSASATLAAPDETYFTREEASAYTGIPLRTLDRYATEGLITRYKLGGRQWVRFARPELDAMLEHLGRPLPEPRAAQLHGE